MITSFVLATGEPSAFGSLMPFVLLMIIFYFLLIRPQQKQRKEQQARVEALKKGDQVITTGGIHASVHHISEKTVTLKLSEGVFVPFEKLSIQTVVKSKGKGKNESKENKEKPASEEAGKE